MKKLILSDALGDNFRGELTNAVNGLFDELCGVELEAEYEYSFTAAKLSGRPEDCYPEEEDGELRITGELTEVEEQLDEIFARVRTEVLSVIERVINNPAQDIEMIREWAEADVADAAAERAEAQYEIERDRRFE